MTDTVRITSKRQITIPAKVYTALELEEGEDLMLEVVDNKICLQSSLALIKELRGSVNLPRRFKGLTPDQIIEKAKEERFKNWKN